MTSEQQPLSDEVAAALDPVLDRYEAARKRGERPPVDDFLAEVSDTHKPTATRELLDLQRHYDEASAKEATVLPGEAPPTPQVNDRVRYFGDYELREEIASGGMGVVWRARQISLSREVALKMILHGDFASEDLRRRFQTEAEAAARLDHPGIVPIYDTGEHDGQPYFAMKFIDGRDLKSAAEEFTDPKSAAALVAKLATAVHHAHQRGIVHRDLKPANVLLNADGQPMLTDFGLARDLDGGGDQTRSGAVLGTPQYMPPEQARGEAVTTAADIYSLGAILYRLVTGRAPHEGESSIDVVRSITDSRPPTPRTLNGDIDRDLEAVILKCLAEKPSDRYASAAELATDLQAWSEGRPLIARPATALDLMKLWLRDHFGNAAWVPVVGAVVGLGGGFGTWVGGPGQDVVSNWHFIGSTLNTDPPAMVRIAQLLQPFGLWMAVTLTLMLGGWVWLAVKPKTATADAVAGLTAGLITGAFFYAGGFGAAANLSMTDQSFQTTKSLWYATDAPQVQAAFVGRQPELEPLQPWARMAVLQQQVTLERYVNPLVGGWVGIAVALFGFAVIGTLQSVVAGRLGRPAAANLWTAAAVSIGYCGFACGLTILIGVLIAWSTFGLAYGNVPMPFPWITAATGLVAVGSLISVACRKRGWLPATLLGIVASVAFFVFGTVELRIVPIARLTAEIKRAEAMLPATGVESQTARYLARQYLRRAEEYGGVHVKGLRLDDRAAADAARAVELFEASDSITAGETYGDAALFDLDPSRSPLEVALVTWVRRSVAADTPDITEAWRSLYTLNEDGPRLAEQALRTGLDDGYRMPAERTAWLAENASGLAESVLDGAAAKALTDRLTSTIRWSLYGPEDSPPLADPEMVRTVLDRETPLHTSLMAGEEPSAAVTANIPAGAKLDLAELLGERVNAVAYAATELAIPADQTVRFLFGSDDGAAVWIDGQLVHGAAGFRQHAYADDTFEVPLTAGRHRVVVKIAQADGRWEMSLDAVDTDGKPLAVW